MKFFGIVSIFFASLGFALDSTQSSGPIVRVVEIRGTINPASASYLQSAIISAEAEKAQLLLIELDTPGGLVSSVREMAQAIDGSKVPVAVFVTPAGASATSAGALLMLAAHVTAMSPGSNVGAAHPVGAQGEKIEGPVGDKAVNDVAAMARGLAELRGRDVQMAEAIVKKSQSMTAQEAHQKKFADFLAESRTNFLDQLHGHVIKIKIKGQENQWTLSTGDIEIRTSEMTWGQKLLHMLAHPNISAVLMTLGMLLIYVEITNPGITIAGVLGVICLLIAFMAFQVLPIQTVGVALLIGGMILMALEPFVVTGGVLAGGGVLSFILGLLWLVDPDHTDLRVSALVWVPAGLALGLGAGLMGWAAARTKRLSRETLAKIGGGKDAGLAGYVGTVSSIAGDGKTGKVNLRGEIWSYQSNEPLSLGDSVEVERVKGFKVFVKGRK